jgi:phospholipid/cholesterol/gamma-HCH transport system permease protein
MMAQEEIQYDSKTRQLICRGDWNLAHLPGLQSTLTSISMPSSGDMTFNGEAIASIDSAGAWLLIQLQDKLKQNGVSVKWIKFSDKAVKLLTIVDEKLTENLELPIVKKPGRLAVLGYNTIVQLEGLQEYFSFIGQLTFELIRLIRHPSHWRWNSLTAVIYRTGYQALPIIGLLSFLIGVVLTYQMGLQLRNYGANIFIVDLLGLSVLREFGPLITAIMVSGRTGSAFTASIGMMKLNQEIDALNTLGVTPAELLLIPRIIGLFIVLPLLTMWADIFGVIGGMITSNGMLGISWYDFLQRFPEAIPLRAFLIGIGKAPVFALIIASVGCFQGMKVRNSAESVGQNTTRSVVLSIFFIIVADAVFSVIFSKLKL